MGFGFMFGMVTIGFVRELLGSGMLLGSIVLGFKPLLFLFFCGGVFLLGYHDGDVQLCGSCLQSPEGE
jgi:electron transport complex protein RnfE